MSARDFGKLRWPLSPRDVQRLNSALRELERLLHISTEEPIELSPEAGGYMLRLNYDGFVVSNDVNDFPVTFDDSVTFNGPVTFQSGTTIDIGLGGEFLLEGIWNQTAQTASLTADTFSWDAPNATWIFISATPNEWTLYSIKAPSPATGRVLELWNTGSYTIKMAHEDAGSTAADRLHWLDGKTRYLDPGAGVALKYNTDASRWYVLWGCCPGPGGRYRKDISTQALASGTSNNVAIPAASSWYASPSANATITGMTEDDGAAPQDGRRLFLKNDTALGSGIEITLNHADSGSSTANQYSSQTQSPVTLEPQEGMWLEYKATNNGGGGGWTSETQYASSKYGQSLNTSSPPPGYLRPPLDKQPNLPTDTSPQGSTRYMQQLQRLAVQKTDDNGGGTDWEPYSADPKLYGNQLQQNYQRPTFNSSPDVGSTFTPTQTPSVSNSSTAYFSLDEATGTDKVDSASGLTLSGNGGADTIASVSGKKGMCCQWGAYVASGLKELISTATVPSFAPGTNGATLSFWFQAQPGSYPDGSGNSPFGGWEIFDGTNGEAFGIYVSQSASTISLRVYGSIPPAAAGARDLSVTYTVPLGTWIFVIGWLDVAGAKMGLSINGTETTSSLGAGWTPADLSAWTLYFATLGNGGGHVPTYCLMDEVNYTLFAPSSSDRTNLYNGGNGAFFPMVNTVDPSTIPQGEKLVLDAYFGSL